MKKVKLSLNELKNVSGGMIYDYYGKYDGYLVRGESNSIYISPSEYNTNFNRINENSNVFVNRYIGTHGILVRKYNTEGNFMTDYYDRRLGKRYHTVK